MKKNLVEAVLAACLHFITKARSDAHLRYVYEGKQKVRGRKRICDGKIEVSKPDKKRIPLLSSDKEKDVYAGMVYLVLPKCQVLAAFVYYKNSTTGRYLKNKKTKKVKPEIILSTDTTMKPREMCRYYGLRFKVESLIRDAKSYCGLEHCQARSEQKLHTHFNIVLTAVSLARAARYLSLLSEQRKEGFSMMDVKMMHMNELLTTRIFSSLDIDTSCKKNKQLYEACLNSGRLRA